MHRLVVTPAAEADLLDAAEWYESRHAGLATAFLMHMQAAFDAARQRPNSFPLAFGEVRRVLAKRFPYAVSFRVVSKTVRIVAVRHTSRNPPDLRNV